MKIDVCLVNEADPESDPNDYSLVIATDNPSCGGNEPFLDRVAAIRAAKVIVKALRAAGFTAVFKNQTSGRVPRTGVLAKG